MNILSIGADRRSCLVQYFRGTLRLEDCGDLIHTANSCQHPAFACADRSVVVPIIYDQGYIPFLLEYCEREEIGMLTPLFDTDVPALTARREAFASANTVVVAADLEAVGIRNDRWRTHGALTEAGIRVPAAWLDGELALGTIEGGRVSWPFMAKPRWSIGSISMYQADYRGEMEVFTGKYRRGIQESYLKYEAMADQEYYVLFQQRTEGLEYGLDAINDLEDRYCATIVRKKTAMQSGGTDTVETVENRELSALGKRLGTLIRHRGNLDVDVLEEDGRYYMLEMNVCFGGGYPFSRATEVNLPLTPVLWAMGREPPLGLLTVRTGVRARRDVCMLVW